MEVLFNVDPIDLIGVLVIASVWLGLLLGHVVTRLCTRPCDPWDVELPPITYTTPYLRPCNDYDCTWVEGIHNV